MSESEDRDLDAAGQPPPTWARPGTVVRYRPHVGCDPWYLGEITGEPRLLGGTWVVQLGRMEAAYRRGRGGAAAAALGALEPVSVPLSDAEERVLAAAYHLRAVIEADAGSRERGAARIALSRAWAEVDS